ncbi:MAG: hypothetical protein ACRD5L_07105 [Bryobacteraceae bacterium]
MNGENKIWREGLKPLSENLPEPGSEIQRRLLLEFRKSYPAGRKRWKPGWWGLSFASAAIAIWIGMIATTRPKISVTLPARLAHARPIPSRPREGAVIKAYARKQVKNAHKPVHQAAPSEIQTAFYALPYANMPADNVQVLRVSLPRSAMSVVGLPVNPERMFEPVQADVAVGEDGIARAIRFVQ